MHSFNTTITALDKVLTKNCGTAITDLALKRYLWGLGIHQILRKSLFSSLTVRFNLFLIKVKWSEIKNNNKWKK